MRLPARFAICILLLDFHAEKQAGKICQRKNFCLRGLGIVAAPQAATAAERGGWSTRLMRTERRKARRGAQAPDIFEFLSYEHCVAVAEKSVALLDCFLVGAENVLAAGKCAD